MKQKEKISINELTHLIKSAFINSKVSHLNAGIVANALVKAEIDGKFGHGVSRVVSYACQSKIGKVDGFAKPVEKKLKPSVISINACNGFAYPAMDKLLLTLPKLAKSQGIALGGVYKSHHFGVAGHIAETAAKNGMISIVLGNTPSAIAPWNGNKALFGTNPLAFGTPTENGDHLIIDLAVSEVARGKILNASLKNEKIPFGWAIDKEGKDTDNPHEALNGTMLPFGGAKGAAIALMIELLSSALVGANFAFEANSFLDANGNPPNVGQILIMIDPASFVTKLSYVSRVGEMMKAIRDQENTYIPGSNRFLLREKAKKEGLNVSSKIIKEITSLC